MQLRDFPVLYSSAGPDFRAGFFVCNPRSAVVFILSVPLEGARVTMPMRKKRDRPALWSCLWQL